MKNQVTEKAVEAMKNPILTKDVPQLPEGSKPVVVIREKTEERQLTDEEIVNKIPYHSLSHLIRKK